MRQVIDGNEQWNVRIGIAVILPPVDDAEDRFDMELWLSATRRIADKIVREPRRSVEVNRIDDKPIQLAVHIHERYHRAPPDSQPAVLLQTHRIDLDDAVMILGTTVVALAEEPIPGVYQMRLKPERWRDRDDFSWAIDDSWHTFFIKGAKDRDRDALTRVPWYQATENEEYN